MPAHNAAVAAIFNEIADLLEIENANPFRVRAYRNAARQLGDWGSDLGELVTSNQDLTTLPGVGKDLASKIVEIVTTGRCDFLERLHGEVPVTVADLLHIPGLGPQRVRHLWHDLGIHTAEQLDQAARDGRIRELPGFGAKSEANIRQALAAHFSKKRRITIALASHYAESLLARLQACPGVVRAEAAGSFRRCADTVGDLDILVTATEDSPVIAAFTGADDVADVLASGATRASVRLKNGLQVDLRLVPNRSYGAALAYFTGSKAHNVALRRLGQERGLKINEYGVFRDDGDDSAIAGESEESVFAAVDLPWIPPELREDRGEIEAARANALPRLVERTDLRGDLHAHTRASDGRDGIEAMVRAAAAAGLEYLAITDHSLSPYSPQGVDADGLARQIDEIDSINESLDGIRLLKGVEADILEDGHLALPDAILARLDLVLGAVHGHFDLPRAKQTERLLRALDQRHFHLLAHPSARLIGQREAIEADWPRILRHAHRRGCHLELDSQPLRLDLTDAACLAAKEAGVLVAIDSDAHGSDDFANLRYGIGQARRGWLEVEDVLNTRGLNTLMKLLRRVNP